MSMLISRWRLLIAELVDRKTAWLYVADRLLGRVSAGRWYIVPYAIYAQPVPSPALRQVRPDAATTVRRCEVGDPLLARMPRPAAELAARLASGAECHACQVRGELAGFIWLRAGWHEEHLAGCRYRVPDGAVWDFDVYIAPKFRLGRTLARMWATVDADLQQRGLRWSFSCISRFNRPSIGSHERLGALRVGRVTFCCLGRLQLTWLPERRLPLLGRHAGTLTLSAPKGDVPGSVERVS